MDAVNDTLLVNLHCHSNLSDGELSPEVLAERLAAAGVRFAALTDHDTVEGTARFREALSRNGVGCVAGVELTVLVEGGTAHLLAYGFDSASPQLMEALRRIHGGGLPLEEAVGLVHGAGGRTFLAHPLQLELDLDRLRTRLELFRAQGLDGIEAIYAPYTQGQILALLALAGELKLAVSAGCDFHGPFMRGLSDLGISLPLTHWRTFRDLLLASPGRPATPSGPSAGPPKRPLPKLDRRNFLLRIVVPTLLAMVLLVVPAFTYIIPAFEEGLLSRKREMIRELTNSACSILQEYHGDEVAGRMTHAEAQAAAAARIQYLRYGKEGKDYFWITDLQPRMVMHPYRTDLNGQDLSAFQDPKGNRVFVESVRLVQAHGEGYQEYLWQWKDDALRLAPKQSYVRLFRPWGWVVGTGIYLDDVHAEIAVFTGRIMWATGLLALVIALLLLFATQQSFRLERQRAVAENALRESHERYRALVEASKEGTVMLLGGRSVFANQTFLNLVGCTEEQWALLSLDEVLALRNGSMAPSQWMASAEGSESEAGPVPVDAVLRRRDGGTTDVLLSTERICLGAREGAILIVRDLSLHQGVLAAREREDRERDALIAELQTALLHLGEPVKRFMREPHAAGFQMPVSQAAALMSRHGVDALLVQGPSGEPLGVFTDHDLRDRVVARGLALDRPLFEVMSSPVLTVSPTAQGHEALLLMRDKGVQHLVVKGEDGAVVGLVWGQDLLPVDRYPLAILARAIRESSGPEEVIAHRGRLPYLVKALLESGARPQHVCRAISAVSDAVVQKLLAFAQAGLGAPPAPYAFMALGSEGREEQTLFSDQDTAIVIDAPEGSDSGAIQAYFLALGDRVGLWLEAAGYPMCPGGMMAGNPRWCQPSARWRHYFSHWIGLAEAQNLMEFSTFFDLRCVHGEAALVSALKLHVRQEVAATPAFLGYLAQTTVQYKTPRGFFGNIVADAHGTFNVKEAMAPLVNLIRLYALHHGLSDTSTFDRMKRLKELGVFSPSAHEDLSQGYDFLMTLRLRHQAERLVAGLPADNDIELKALTHIDESLLKQVFAQITLLQKKVGFDFLGGG